MNKDIVRKWIIALRSGDYAQTRYVHREGDNFCVMGVLCDLHAKEFKRENYWFPVGGSNYSYGPGVIPESIEDWLGEGSRDILKLGHVVHLNDHQCKPFAQLATYIEDKMKEYDPSFVA